jgi:hypothetical protein
MMKFLRIILIPALVLIFSCENQGFFVQCSDCAAEEPLTAFLSAELDPDYYSSALIQIWEGNLEDSILLGSYTTAETTFEKEVVLNKRYTITATYQIDNKTIIAVDAATPKVRYEKSQCDDPCYFVYDRKCNLKLRYNP